MSAKPCNITFEPLATQHFPERVGFRPNTPMWPMRMNFIFMNGGMGDYITWLTPIMWLCKEATWIHGSLVHPIYLQELVDYFLGPFPDWTSCTYKGLQDIPQADTMPFRGPVVLQQESLNATGAHLMTCGWVYFTNKESAPPGWEHYVRFNPDDLAKVPMPAGMDGMHKYAVITTGVTTPSRQIPGNYWNHVIKYVRSLGLTPVFLGKGHLITGNPRNVHTSFSGEIDYSAGVDLRDKTSLMQAAAIMQRSAVVIGHDNGLLHLAGCTDAPIVFGYNLASPQHRQPLRKIGKVYNVTLSRDELPCIHCQSHTNFVIGYNFQRCFYGDNKCLDLLFANEAQKWKVQIDLALTNQ